MILALLLVLAVLFVTAVFRLLLLREDLTGFKEYWVAEAAKPVPAGAITYIALGDSAAQGIGASKPEKSYVGLLTTALAQKTGRPVHVINLSVSGAKIKDIAEKQIPQLENYQVTPDTVVTIDIGGNDMRNFVPSTFESDYKTMLGSLPKQTIVADIPYFGPDFHGHGGRQAKLANDIARPLIAEYGLKTANLYEITKNNDSFRNYAADFFHPSDHGYRNWYQAFWNVLGKQ